MFNTTLAVDIPELLQRGQHAFEQGAFIQATQYWEVALAEPSASLQYTNLLIQMATAYQAVYQFDKAYQSLQKAATLAEKQGSLAQQALIYSHLSNVLLAMQKPKEAEVFLQKGIILLRVAHEPYALAHLQDNFGYLYFWREDYSTALNHYQQAIELADKHGNLGLFTQNLIHLGWVYLKQDNLRAAVATLQNALAQVAQQSASYNKAKQLVELGYLGLQLQIRVQSPLAIERVLKEALILVKQYQDRTLLVVALGCLGQAYEQTQNFTKALALTERAIQHAQGLDDLLYFWVWQRGRLLQKQGHLTKAITVYKQALTYQHALHRPFMTDHINTTDIFRSYIRPVYRHLLDILLQQAMVTTKTAQRITLLKEVRDTFEQLVIATIKDYYKDMPFKEKYLFIDPFKQLKKSTAVLYLLTLPDRIELLLITPAGFIQKTTRVTEETVSQTVQRLNQQIQEVTHFRFIEPATQLYRWLIAPLYPQLVQQQIDTLVIIPEGILLTIPFAALFDNTHSQFLIEQFALAITPSLNLTIPYSSSKRPNQVLLTGLAEMVTGYAELKTALQQVTEINALLNTDMLLDAKFTLENVQKTLQSANWSILHIASHCRIFPKPTETFLLTYNGRINLNQLANLLNGSQDLLTLSYCQVATANEQTFLGLTSLAFKLGVHSVLSNLWFVDDESTVILMKAFYTHLKQSNMSETQALQRAQIELLKQPAFRHPYHWATFQLTGCWF